MAFFENADKELDDSLPEKIGERKYDKDGNEILGVLTSENYWKWRTTIEELDHCKTKVHLKQAIYKAHHLEIERAKLVAIEAKRNVVEQMREVEKYKEDYENTKKEIESSVGCSLNGCVIDQFTYEVKKIEEVREKDKDGSS